MSRITINLAASEINQILTDYFLEIVGINKRQYYSPQLEWDANRNLTISIQGKSNEELAQSASFTELANSDKFEPPFTIKPPAITTETKTKTENTPEDDDNDKHF